jgi:hypothetical protein
VRRAKSRYEHHDRDILECDAIEKNEVDSMSYYLGNGNTLQALWESVLEPSALVLIPENRRM